MTEAQGIKVLKYGCGGCLGVAALLLLLFFTWESRPVNYVSVDYVDGDILFYVAGDTGYTKLPNNVGFLVFTHDNPFNRHIWGLNNCIGEDSYYKCRGYEKCTSHIAGLSLAFIRFGVKPYCYYYKGEQESLSQDTKYMVSNSYTPRFFNKELVYFKLVQCEGKKDEICLETNSPARDNHRRYGEAAQRVMKAKLAEKPEARK